jgi:hypothetical protein
MRFVAKILELFPRCPRDEAGASTTVPEHSGRVGPSGAAKALDKKAITLAVRVHVRHCHTRYDNLLAEGFEPVDAPSAYSERDRGASRQLAKATNRPNLRPLDAIMFWPAAAASPAMSRNPLSEPPRTIAAGTDGRFYGGQGRD